MPELRLIFSVQMKNSWLSAENTLKTIGSESKSQKQEDIELKKKTTQTMG